MYVCKQVGLSTEEMEMMPIGLCMDFIQEYIDNNTDEKDKTRKATQQDFDAF